MSGYMVVKLPSIRILEYCTYTCMYTRVNMHNMLKVETLVTSTTEDPTGDRTWDLLIASQTFLPLSYWVSGACTGARIIEHGCSRENDNDCKRC